jgi:hypothetical protein
MQNNQSEVARVKADIELHYRAAQYAQYGTSVGTSQHKVISRNMTHVGKGQEELVGLIGENDATVFLIDTMNKEMRVQNDC